VDGDAFQPPANIKKVSVGTPLTDQDRQPWLAAMRVAIASWVDNQEDIVLACSALKQDYRDLLQISIADKE